MSKPPLQDLPFYAPERIRRTSRKIGARSSAGAILVVLFVLVGAGSALAHTSFESSSPADGAVFDTPVSVVTISFTNAATPAGDEFLALDASGQIRTPAAVSTVDGRIFELMFDPPLSGGQVGIRWTVQAGDAHPIDGSFSFTVNTPIVAEPIAESTVAEVDTAAAAPSTGTGSDDTTLDEFLSSEPTSSGETTSSLGRIIGLLGVVLGIGSLAFLALVHRGSISEIGDALTAVRILGLVIAAGATLEYIGIVQLGDRSLFTAFLAAPGFSAALRIGGGLALALGLVSNLVPVRKNRPRQLLALSSAVLESERPTAQDPLPQQARRQVRQRDSDTWVRWQADTTSWPAFAGVAAVVVSFWFDGHTVSKGPRLIHAMANSAHLLAGSVWAGGVIAIAFVLWRRFRQGRPMRAYELVLRFSPIATVSLAAVAAAGLLMAVFVLDSFGELTGTPWGQILMLKTAAVGLATVGGAYNHFQLIPELESAPDDEELLAAVRSTIAAEAIMLFFVVVVTAWLVAAAS